MTPVVRHMLLCEDARARPGAPGKIDVFGLVSSVSTKAGAFPARLSFCVYAVLTGGRGSGSAQVVVLSADTDDETYTGQPHQVTFRPDPLAVSGLLFRVPSCPFPKAGLYWVELRYNGQMIAREPLLVQEVP